METINVDNIKAQMRKGILEYCILSILSKGDAYVSDIINELKDSEMIVVEGTLYPLLTRQKNQAEYAKAFSSLNDNFCLKFGVFSNVNDCVCFLDKKDISKDEIRAHIRKLKNDPHYQWFKGPNAITGF